MINFPRTPQYYPQRTIQGKPAKVGRGVRIGSGAVVCGGNTVGRNAVVAAVEDVVPDRGVWMGGRLAAKYEGRTWE